MCVHVRVCACMDVHVRVCACMCVHGRIFLLFQKENALGVIHKLLSLLQRVGASLLLLRSEQWSEGGGCQKIAIFERTYFMDDPMHFS